MEVPCSDRIFVFGCTVISFFGRFKQINTSRFGMFFVRLFYNFLCLFFTGRREPVQQITDYTLATPKASIKIREYTPDASAKNSPAILFMHGGCFAVGDLNSHDSSLRALANASQCKIFSVDYRRAPENKYPAAANDCYNALLALEKNAQMLGIDSKRIALMGDSAGAALAAVLARWCRDRKGPAIAFQVLLYPATDAAMQTDSWSQFPGGPGLDRTMLASAWERYAPLERDRLSPDVSPLRASEFAGLPCTLLVTADRDPLRDEGKAYAAALNSAGVDVQHSHYLNSVHGFFQHPDKAHGRQLIVEIAAYARARFKQAKPNDAVQV